MSNQLAMVESGYRFEEGGDTGDRFREEGFREEDFRETSFRDLFVDPLPLVLLLLFKGIPAMYPVWCLVGLGRVVTSYLLWFVRLLCGLCKGIGTPRPTLSYGRCVGKPFLIRRMVCHQKFCHLAVADA
jgi:hypothetical protein